MAADRVFEKSRNALGEKQGEGEKRSRRGAYVVLLLYWGALLGALVTFGLLAEDVLEQEPFGFDTSVLTWLDAHQLPFLTGLAQAFSLLGSLVVLGVLTTLAYLYFRRRSSRDALLFVLSVLGALALNVGAKLLFARVRPELFTPLEPALGYSFPSGHAMLSAAFGVAFFVVIRRQFPRWRVLAGIAALVFILGISLSRPYLQVHYPSDILAGWTLSCAWVAGLGLWFRRRRKG